jgi:mitochondrial inner membrane protease ATP23
MEFQACVRRRAVESVMANPVCPDRETAEKAVNEVWESCFSDTRPFDEVRKYRR